MPQSLVMASGVANVCADVLLASSYYRCPPSATKLGLSLFGPSM